MADEKRSLVKDLAGSVRAALGGDAEPDRLAVLEEEHQTLCVRRRHLHEIIDGMEAADSLRRDSAAMLARYKISEKDVSFRRGLLYREIMELRQEEPRRVTPPPERPVDDRPFPTDRWTTTEQRDP